jgi:hypothetical protein
MAKENTNTGTNKELYSTKERRELQARILEKYRQTFHPLKDEQFKNISFEAIQKLAHTIGGDLKNAIGKDLYSDAPSIKFGVPLMNWSNEALKVIEPYFRDVKIEENVVTDKDKIVTFLEEAFKKRFPHKNKKFSTKNTRVSDVYNHLMADTSLDNLPNLGKHKALSVNTPISKLSLEAVNATMTALKIGA